MTDYLQATQEPWGRTEVLHQEEGISISMLTVGPRQALCLAGDPERHVQLVVLEGGARFRQSGSMYRLAQDSEVRDAGQADGLLANEGNRPLRVLSIRSAQPVDEETVLRFKKRYGRYSVHASAPVVICEIGCNHKGDMNIALEMIRIAAEFCGVGVVKFQKRNNRELLSDAEFTAPHPVPANAYGETYGAHREYLEFDLSQHRVLKDWCEDCGVEYSTSVWDLSSAREIAGLGPGMIKIPSAINTNQRVLDFLFAEYGGEIHVSLGMTRRDEEKALIDLAARKDRLGDLVVYHCISGYPVENEDLFLLEIHRLIDSYGDSVKAVGFSGHHRGIAPDTAALALGATHFERHFTLDRTWKGTDHAASLEPDGLRRLTRDLSNVAVALKRKVVEILPEEQVQREKLKQVVDLVEGT